MGQVELLSRGTDRAVPSLSSPVSPWLHFLGHYSRDSNVADSCSFVLSPSLKDYGAQAAVKWQPSSCLSHPNVEMMSITPGLNYAWLLACSPLTHAQNRLPFQDDRMTSLQFLQCLQSQTDKNRTLFFI